MSAKGRPFALLSNRPLIVSALYLLSYFTGMTWIVGVVLAYIFRSGQQEDWEVSHFIYHIRTFWLMAGGMVLAICGLILVLGGHGLAGLLYVPFSLLIILCSVRSVLALINAVTESPMPRPHSWLV